MIPWIKQHLSGSANDELFDVQKYQWAMPLVALTSLLWEIVQGPKDKERLVVFKAPRSIVWHGYGEASYLYHKKSSMPFASIEDVNGITSMTLRYNDPLDPGSGLRKERAILTGWQGTVALIASAMRQSKVWKELQTIEVDPWIEEDYERVTYQVWAKPRYDRIVSWDIGLSKADTFGGFAFKRNKPELLANVEVVRERINGQLVEEVISVQVFPGLNDKKRLLHISEYFATDRGTYFPGPHFVDASDQSMMRIQPHDEMKLNVNWS